MSKMQEGLKKYRKQVLNGEIKPKKRPSMIKAIRAKCKDCTNTYADGRNDCEIEDCSLYAWMPYGRLVKERMRAKGLVDCWPLEGMRSESEKERKRVKTG